MDNNQYNPNDFNANSNQSSNVQNNYNPNNYNPNSNPNYYNPNPNSAPNYTPYNYPPQQQNYTPYAAPYDPNLQPMTLKDWVITFLLLMIPFANFILPFVWAFGSNVNRSKKTFFQAYFIMMLIGIGIWVICFLLFAGFLTSLFSSLEY